jgi:hypothetical protein
VAYALELLPEVRQFLIHCPDLSRADRLRLFDNLHSFREHAEHYRGETARRLSSGSEHFSFDLILRTESGALRHFRFVISDAFAAYGVLRVVYADEL